MGIGDHLRDGQTKAGAADGAVAGHVKPFKRFHKSIDGARRKARPIVVNLDRQGIRERLDANPSAQALFDCVLYQITQ